MASPKSMNVQFEDLRTAIKKVNLTSQLNDAPIFAGEKESAINAMTKSAITFHEDRTVRQTKPPQQLNNRSRQALRDLRIDIDRVQSGAEGGDEALQKATDAAVEALRDAPFWISASLHFSSTNHFDQFIFRKEHQPPLLTLDDAYSLPTEAGLLDLYREQSCLETIQRFQYYPENDDDDEQGLSVEVESASGLDILGHLSSSESLGFTPTSRRNCWLLWDNLMSSTREEIVRKLSIKIRDTIGDLNDHGLNPYYTAYDREEGYETPICRVAAGHYVQHKWAAVFKPTVEQITSVARHSLLRPIAFLKGDPIEDGKTFKGRLCTPDVAEKMGDDFSSDENKARLKAAMRAMQASSHHLLEIEDLESDDDEANLTNKNPRTGTKEDPWLAIIRRGLQGGGCIQKALLITAKTGGVALYIQDATIIVQLGIWWNRNTERQAYARVHRQGQESGVKIYRLRARNGMVDTEMLRVQQKKTKGNEKLMAPLVRADNEEPKISKIY
ncbi:MAG: hypothetical protein ASARMPRED_008563 [Alectoria sarmentosa]|nr:MAG: hypothetical protein ASARMPRED_008563 [Alectoria sarmentosa]